MASSSTGPLPAEAQWERLVDELPMSRNSLLRGITQSSSTLTSHSSNHTRPQEGRRVSPQRGLPRSRARSSAPPSSPPPLAPPSPRARPPSSPRAPPVRPRRHPPSCTRLLRISSRPMDVPSTPHDTAAHIHLRGALPRSRGGSESRRPNPAFPKPPKHAHHPIDARIPPARTPLANQAHRYDPVSPHREDRMQALMLSR